MVGTRIIITAPNLEWALIAARTMTGFATSVIACGAEAGIGVLIKIDKAIDIRGNPIICLLSLSTLTPCHTRRFRGYADQLGFLSQACLARPLPGSFSSLFRF